MRRPPLHVVASHVRCRWRWWAASSSCIWCAEGLTLERGTVPVSSEILFPHSVCFYPPWPTEQMSMLWLAVHSLLLGARAKISSARARTALYGQAKVAYGGVQKCLRRRVSSVSALPWCEALAAKFVKYMSHGILTLATWYLCQENVFCY